MTDELNDVLSRRADRARPPADAGEVIAGAVARARTRSRRRRTRLAIASGTAVVIAAATVGIAIADPGGGPRRAAPQQPGVYSNSAAAPSTRAATELPVIRPLHGTASGHGVGVRSAAARRRLERERELAAARHLQVLRAKQAARAARHTTLVPVDPAPAKAEISIGLVPKGFEYLSLDNADAFYGPDGLTPRDYYSKGIVVDVSLTYGATTFPLTVNGKPASYQHTANGYTLVRIEYSKRVDVGFQAPPAVPLTEGQALQIAATIDVRSTTHKTK